jgi:pimeloyl-ACP methyl ester carboxylesterase
MATYVELPQVKTWYDERGEGEPLVLLHGGVVDASFFEANIDGLAARFRVFALILRGHGHTPDVEGPLTYQALAPPSMPPSAGLTRSAAWSSSAGRSTMTA